MGAYKLIIKTSVFKDVADIPKDDLVKIDERMRNLAEDPRPIGCHKLSFKDFYRIRYGDYRILYAIDDKSQIVRIMKIGHRREVYR